jgi:predicted GNAT family N-acyltransferase
LTRLRFDVFVHEQGVPEDLELDEEEDTAAHFLALDAAGEPLGCVRLTSAGKITRLCVASLARRAGVGRALLQRGLDEARRQGFSVVYLHAQTQASSLYLSAGFLPEGDVFMEAGIPHQRMTLAL